jgi:hypothetical protein
MRLNEQFSVSRFRTGRTCWPPTIFLDELPYPSWGTNSNHYLRLPKVLDLFCDFEMLCEQLKLTLTGGNVRQRDKRKCGSGKLTFPISPGGLGSIAFKLRTISAHRIPDDAKMTMDGVPGLFNFLGREGSSVCNSPRCQVNSWLNPSERTCLDEVCKVGKISWESIRRRRKNGRFWWRSSSKHLSLNQVDRSSDVPGSLRSASSISEAFA